MKHTALAFALGCALFCAVPHALRAADFGVLMEEGNRAQQLGDLPRALAVFHEALLLPVSSEERAMIYNNRGSVYGLTGQVERALADFAEAIRLNPLLPISYSNRGNVRLQQQDYRGALADYREAAKLAPDAGLNGLAWLLATCPDAAIRDGKAAVQAATEACQLTRWSNWQYLDTLAAAHAETGDFVQAIQCAKRAQETNGITERERQEIQQRLELYRAHQPYRDEPKSAEPKR